MIGLLNIPDFLVDLIKVQTLLIQPKGVYEAYGTCYSKLCGWLDNLFTLVRSDAMAYINISGLPFCNSARYCEFLCNNSKLFSGSESPLRVTHISNPVLSLRRSHPPAQPNPHILPNLRPQPPPPRPRLLPPRLLLHHHLLHRHPR